MATNAPKAGAVAAPARDQKSQTKVQKITTFLWFDNNAEEAVNFYLSIFKNSKIIDSTRYGGVAPGPKGSIMTIDFELDGERFVALNGGPQFKFSEAISLVVNCKDQNEIDYFWEKLSEGGQKVECGWLKDKFGLSWQIVPEILPQLLAGGDQKQTDRVMAAVMKMKKLDLAEMQKAAAG